MLCSTIAWTQPLILLHISLNGSDKGEHGSSTLGASRHSNTDFSFLRTLGTGIPSVVNGSTEVKTGILLDFVSGNAFYWSLLVFGGVRLPTDLPGLQLTVLSWLLCLSHLSLVLASVCGYCISLVLSCIPIIVLLLCIELVPHLIISSRWSSCSQLSMDPPPSQW